MRIYNPSYAKKSFHFTQKEIQDLLVAWAALSLAFSILNGFGPTSLIVSAITVGAGFLLHELAHKLVAQYYRCVAHFRADYKMLGLAILFSFAGFVFAAPGAVMVSGVRNVKHMGHIAAAGPLVNLVLALWFALMPFGIISAYGAMINSWLALFNMIPIGPFDGAKIWRWDRRWFFGIVIVAILFMVFL